MKSSIFFSTNWETVTDNEYEMIFIDYYVLQMY